jgi:uncharacterized protein (TIGR03118 family)
MTDDETDTLSFKGDSMLQQSALVTLRRFIVVCFAMALLGSTTLLAQTYVQTNLVSDIPGLAPTTDHFLVNPWGIARAPAGPWWVSDNETGVSTLYNGLGVPIENPPGSQFVVNIPNAPNSSGNASPTGTVFNGSSDFHGDIFIFVAEDGIISGWNPAVNLFNAHIEVDHSATAIYKGVTIASFNGANYLYAADFHTGTLEIFDKNFQPFSFGANAFVDPQIPDGFGPFNVQAIGNAVVVTYAKQDEDAEDEVAGKGLGFVDVFTPNGTLIMRLESGDWMNAPWGVALAPANFGELSNRLLIGNFGSGLIAAFDAADGSFVSFLKQSPGAPMKINGLWGLGFGNNAAAGPSNTLFFAAGHANEHHGVFGAITSK